MRYLAAKNQVTSLRQRSHELWQEGKKNERFLRIALVALIAPIALFLVPNQVRRPVEKARPTVLAPPPVVNLEDRLAFGHGLRDRLASRGNDLSLEPSTPSGDTRDAPRVAEVHQQTQTQAAPAVSPPTIPPIVMDDRKWSLPYGSLEFAPTDLPETPEASFRSELAISELMNVRTTVASEAVATIAPVPNVRREVEKRKKVVVQKRRPAKVNQMTAAASPQPTVQPGPNLPPPPILFFLGAPPPPQP